MEKDAILHIRVADSSKLDLDTLRKREPDLPSRSEMVRRLIDRAKANLDMPVSMPEPRAAHRPSGPVFVQPALRR